MTQSINNRQGVNCKLMDWAIFISRVIQNIEMQVCLFAWIQDIILSVEN